LQAIHAARLCALALLTVLCATARAELPPIDPDATHTERWNWFAGAVLALHEQRIAGREIETRRRIGGYARRPAFYEEVKYIDAASGQLLSVIQWEREQPDNLHWIEVYVRDEAGRVVRDYSAAFLPTSRSQPQQALINLHAYNGGLHAFRQFDATDNRIYEHCEGELNGEPVRIRLFELDIIRMRGEPGTVMASPEYQACFEGLPQDSAGPYLTPR
jgi:hypothetical protein